MSGERQPARPGASSQQHPELYLVISNISKRANVRSLLLNAAAFGCDGVYVVGQKSFDVESDVPGKIADLVERGGLPIRRFRKWDDEFTNHLKENRIRLVGVEIHEDAKPIEAYLNDSNGKIAFVMGNEGQGLNEKQIKSCEGNFVRIPQYGAGTASLNVAVAASIVLHRYHEWKRAIIMQTGNRRPDL